MNYQLSPNLFVLTGYLKVLKLNTRLGPFIGVVSCAETLSADSQTVKTLFLARLIKEASCGLTILTVTCKFTKSSGVVA